MPDDRALRLLLDACNETLADARAGRTWLADAIPELERLCAKIAEQLATQTS